MFILLVPTQPTLYITLPIFDKMVPSKVIGVQAAILQDFNYGWHAKIVK